MKFFPTSEHHTADYRIDLGQWVSQDGVKWDLGIAELHWADGEVYYSDYSLPSAEAPDYHSGDIRWNHWNVGNKNAMHFDRYNEIIRRALKAGIPLIGHYGPQIEHVYWDGNGGSHRPSEDVEYAPIAQDTDWEPDETSRYTYSEIHKLTS